MKNFTEKLFEADVEAVLQYILASEEQDYKEQCEERGAEDCEDHIYRRAERALDNMGMIVFRTCDAGADEEPKK